MRIGLIARDEIGRGLAIQTKSFYDHMKPDAVLLVHDLSRRQEAGDNWYPGALEVEWDTVTHTLDYETMQKFLRGIDVVFTAETPYDWSMLELARELGVKTVIQGNPEFFRHGLPRGPTETQHPDEWWWPSGWRRGQLPPGPLMPCPQPERDFAPGLDYDGPLRILHVIGKRAWKDRNGTDTFMQVARIIREKAQITMFSMDGDLPEVWPTANVEWKLFPDGVKDRWDLYKNQDVLVLPRRYGGNCLPVLEAAACGLAVVMPNMEPNAEYTPLLTSISQMRNERLPCGMTPICDPDPYSIASTLDLLARDRGLLLAEQQAAYMRAPRWTDWATVYRLRLENLCYLS